MSATLDPEIIALLEDRQTLKVLATVDDDGIPHAVVKEALLCNQDGNLQVLELIEASQSNHNLLRSLWFDKPVAVLIKGQDGRSFQIKGVPIKAHLSGPVFQKYYSEVRGRLGDVDLAAVWIIRPDVVIGMASSPEWDSGIGSHGCGLRARSRLHSSRRSVRGC
jgi:predicted pyridoxine 5'-phosphate oxidase superfamily flavin-nucleotide-binding protein